MRLSTIIRFQLGQASAIEGVARNRNSLFVGMFLVLLTAIPRNYDQTFFTESPFWLLGPLIFSFFSGSFLFLFLYSGFIRRHLEDREGFSFAQQWRGFMAAFWMTAPVAWLYAIPVERFLTSYNAAIANLSLLGIVSLWRVLLMSRVISVLQGIHFIRALGWVLIPACLEVVLIALVGGIFSPSFGKRIMAGMSGMRNAPEEDLQLLVLGKVFVGALLLLITVLALLGARRLRGAVSPFPKQSVTLSRSFFPLAMLAACWIAVAIPAQLQQKRFVTHAKLIANGEYRSALDYLARHGSDAFPRSRRTEPNPYEHRAFEALPKVFAVLQPTDPEWIRKMYLQHLSAMLSHRWIRMEPIALKEVLEGVDRLSEGTKWAQDNRTNFSKVSFVRENDSAGKQIRAEEEIPAILLRLGIDITDTNLNIKF